MSAADAIRSAEPRRRLAGQNLAADEVKKTQRLFMAPHTKPTAVFQGHSHNPYNAEKMIRMGVRYENVVDILNAKTSTLHLREDSVSAAGIHKHDATARILQREAGIVASRAMGIARAEHRYLCVSFHPKSLW